MQRDNETTATQLQNYWCHVHGYKISIRTVLRCRSSLGWTFRGSAYCQLIVNKQKRLAWTLAHQNDTFDDVIWSEEISLLSSLSEVRSIIVLAICVNDTWQQNNRFKRSCAVRGLS